MNTCKNNPLKEYFLNLMEQNNLKNYRELSRFLNVTYGIIGNTMQNNTIFASRKLTEQLSKTLQRKPEDILYDIYSPYFFQHCPDHLKIITLSLHYHFKYKLYWENNIIIESHLVRLPYIEKQISIHAIMRREGLEAKYTAIVDYCEIRNMLCNTYYDYNDYSYDYKNPTKPFNSWNTFMFAMISGFSLLLNIDSMSSIKRIIVAFPTNEMFAYKNTREELSSSSKKILPLLYDNDAEYSIRDIDQI